MTFSTIVRLLKVVKYLALTLGLCGVYAAYSLFSMLSSDRVMMLTVGQSAAAVAKLPGKTHFQPRDYRSLHDKFRSEYYALGMAISESPPAFPAARTFVEAVNPEYYGLLPLAEDLLRCRPSGAGCAAAESAFNKAVARIARLSLEAARWNAEESNLLLVKTGLTYFGLFCLLLLLELADNCFICKPLFQGLSALSNKLRRHTGAPDQRLPAPETEAICAGVDSLLADLETARTALMRLEQEAAVRQARIKIQNSTLELTRKKVMALVEDLEETRGELQIEKKALKTTGEKLERSNKELEQFAYIASHDLKEPLRIVSSFSALLSKRYAASLDSDAADFIRYISEGAKRSTELIEALFSYSKVTCATRDLTIVPAMTALQKAMFNLKISIEEKKARISCDGLPPLKVNEFQLIQLFQNLISNSLKFNNAPEPEIRVSFTETAEAWTLRFSDNGIGISHEHYERIFLVFQRLHSQEKYPGAGIGLALCKKIAENHGGRIWVESSPGAGSTFFVEFPRHHEAETAVSVSPGSELAKKAD